MGFFSIWQILNLLWIKFYVIGQILIVVNRKILKNNLAIWSHWSYPRWLPRLIYILFNVFAIHLQILLKSWPLFIYFRLFHMTQINIGKLIKA